MIKKILPDLIAILAFVLISFAYFFPADIEGRILFQHDTAAGAGAGQEAKEYYEQTGERTRWTNSLFGGMLLVHAWFAVSCFMSLGAMIASIHS